MARSLLLRVALFGILFSTFPSFVFADPMASTNYQIPWDVWSSGGDEQGSSASYRIDDTIGEAVVGAGTSASYSTNAGYRLGDEQALSFAVTMAPVGGTSAAYSALNVSGKTITLAGVTNPFSVGQYIAIIENPGLSQKTAVARIGSIVGMTITVDRFDGQDGSMSASPASGQVVALSGGDIAFGSASVTDGSVATGMTSVNAPTPSGYTLYMQAAAALASGSHTFTPVGDGSVTAGSEEYGVRSYGSTAQLTVDTAISTAAFAIQQSTALTSTGGDRTALLYKLAISSSTPEGAYTQSVFFTLTPNY